MIKAIAANCPKLTHLNATAAPDLRNKAIKAIKANCQSLEDSTSRAAETELSDRDRCMMSPTTAIEFHICKIPRLTLSTYKYITFKKSPLSRASIGMREESSPPVTRKAGPWRGVCFVLYALCFNQAERLVINS